MFYFYVILETNKAINFKHNDNINLGEQVS